MRLAILSIVALLTSSVLTSQELTLEEAIHLALESNPSLQSTSLESAKLHGRRASVKSQFLPEARVFAIGGQPLGGFDFMIARGALGVDSGLGAIPESDVKLRTPAHPIGLGAVIVTQPLSSIPTIKKNLALIDVQQEIAEQQTRLERQSLVRDVRQLYYQLQAVQSTLRAARENIRLTQEVERVTLQYVQNRQVLDADYLEAQVHLAKAMEDLLELENQRETLKANLNHKLGRDIRTEFSVREVSMNADLLLSDFTENLAEASQRAIAQRPEVRQAELKLEQAQAETRIAAASFNPIIAAQYIGIEVTNVNAFLPRHIGIAGVSLTWEPFTWRRKQHDLEVHRIAEQQSAYKAAEVKSQIEIEVADLSRRVELASARLHVAALRRQMATESLRVATRQYEAQYSLVKTVLQAQSFTDNVNADYERTLSELWTAVAEYERARGDER
jgi:outer membrane protein TolC